MKRKQRDTTRFEVQKRSVCEFFEQDAARWQKVLPFLRGEDGLTLRLVDHFVTSYSRKNVCETRNEGGVVNVYHNMQTALRHGLNKKRLDPFYRKHSSDAELIKMKDGTETNVCQLTFFRWALVTGALSYIEQHKDEIRKDMRAMNREIQKRRKSSGASGGASGGGAVREIVIELPPDIADDPHETERLRITLSERLQQPKKKRKRIRDDKVDAVARLSGGADSRPVLEFEKMRG